MTKPFHLGLFLQGSSVQAWAEISIVISAPCSM